MEWTFMCSECETVIVIRVSSHFFSYDMALENLPDSVKCPMCKEEVGLG